MIKNIFNFITTEETNYRFPIRRFDSNEWSMRDHIKKTIFYKDSMFTEGLNNNKRPFKNIIVPILNLQYRSEGFDIKDIELFIDNKDAYFKSFFIRKFHEKWARDNDIDTVIDESVESYVDFGGMLLKNVEGVRPDVVPLETIAFCDQTDILASPFAIKHYFSPSELLDYAKRGWGDESNGATNSLENIIAQMEQEKKTDEGLSIKTPGKFIQVYEIHGQMLKGWLDDSDSNEYVQQIQIVVLNTTDKEAGSILYRKKENILPFKFLKRDPIYGRALGRGGAEELFQSQLWTNYGMIRLKEMLDSASKTLLKTTDPTIRAKHPKGLADMDNLEFIEMMDGKDVAQLDTFPRSATLFDNFIKEQEIHGRWIGSAQEAISGEEPPAGTPFASVQFQAMESHSLHEYRRGKIAKFWGEVYRDWIIPYLSKEVVKGQEFLTELSLDEMESISDTVATNQTNKMILKKIIYGELIYSEDIEMYAQGAKENFLSMGNKRFLSILKDEMKKEPIGVYVNVAGKQKNLSLYTDKLVNLVKFVFSTYDPNTRTFAAFDDPRMVKIINPILEYSGMSPIDYGATSVKPRVSIAPQKQVVLKEMPKQPIG